MEFPEWFHDLFLKFSFTFGQLWTSRMSSDASTLAMKMEWWPPLSRFDGKTVRAACEKVKTMFDHPPSIKQFWELCKIEHDRNLRSSIKVVEPQYTRRHPPSEAVARHMAENPMKPDDPMAKIFREYKGQELGKKIIEELLRKMGRAKA